MSPTRLEIFEYQSRMRIIVLFSCNGLLLCSSISGLPYLTRASPFRKLYVGVAKKPALAAGFQRLQYRLASPSAHMLGAGLREPGKAAARGQLLLSAMAAPLAATGWPTIRLKRSMRRRISHAGGGLVVTRPQPVQLRKAVF